MANIIRIARLILALEDNIRSAEQKSKIIDMYKELGVISKKDAKELKIEYCYD